MTQPPCRRILAKIGLNFSLLDLKPTHRSLDRRERSFHFLRQDNRCFLRSKNCGYRKSALKWQNKRRNIAVAWLLCDDEGRKYLQALLQILLETDIEHSEAVLAPSMFETNARSAAFFLRSSDIHSCFSITSYTTRHFGKKVIWIDTKKYLIFFFLGHSALLNPCHRGNRATISKITASDNAKDVIRRKFWFYTSVLRCKPIWWTPHSQSLIPDIQNSKKELYLGLSYRIV